MDKAKAAIGDFMSKSGKHDTTVHETVAPAVQHETVKQHQHEELNTAIDKEVHQDHYHRTVQPVHDREVLPEQHSANLGAVQHREFDHREADVTRRNLEQEQAAFKDKRVVQDKTHSQSANAAVTGEHVHHHVHEVIQPVVHKETIQPNVVHTTIPIHEVHHNAATHHESSELPAMSLADFKQKGGILGGRGERYDGFEGEPKNIGGTLKGLAHGGHGKHDSASHESHFGGAGAGASAAGLAGAGTTRSGHRERRGSNSSSSSDDATGTRKSTRHQNQGLGSHTTQSKTQGYQSNTLDQQGTKAKPSLMNKLNPKVDANGDGKAGFMQ